MTINNQIIDCIIYGLQMLDVIKLIEEADTLEII